MTGIPMIIEDTWGGDITTAAITHLAHSTQPEVGTPYTPYTHLYTLYTLYTHYTHSPPYAHYTHYTDAFLQHRLQFLRSSRDRKNAGTASEWLYGCSSGEWAGGRTTLVRAGRTCDRLVLSG